MVSIILPNLNTPIHYLEERVATIIGQSYEKWECIIVDGYSDNGSWEYLVEVSKRDQRFKAYQFKKEGIYKAWNCGIELATGEYIYIATSDDTMSPDFIEKMVHALNSNRECDIAHCCLTIIDENSKPSAKTSWDLYYPAQYFNGTLKKSHIRYAPHDGILHCGLKTVYTSVTQLLIRSAVFEKVGYFLTRHGSIADFEWGMRASLACNVIHVPEYLATWRYYEGQATSDSIQSDYKTYRHLRHFIRHAFKINNERGYLASGKFDIRDLQFYYLLKEFQFRIKPESNVLLKLKIYFHYFLLSPGMIIEQVLKRITKREELNNIIFTREKIKQYKLEGHVRIL